MRALADFTNNFTFSRGVHFQSPKMYQHIVPGLLKRVWEVDNKKQQVLWEMGNQGGVSGDVFVKIAYDPAYADAAGKPHPGRVRLLVLNASYCFPEWHPHDREKLLRFKLKYRFWGTTAEGTRQVFTYTEILTDTVIEEYVNDELVDQRPNPLGMIPIVHIPNIEVSGSPWGQSDIGDIVPLNREYNEKATDVSDIINYHVSPVTIITGAKASNLEKGARKVWAGLPKDANVFNLQGGTDALPHALAYLALLKTAMHEMTGVPETALGQVQPISNTSGVALAIQWQSMMAKYHQKRITYTVGLERINELILRTLFFYEPETLAYDPTTEGLMEDGQPAVLDPNDPVVYQIECDWPAPLPVDVLVKLNEIQVKMSLGLESKRGALKDLGEEFPAEKLQEIFEEIRQDTLDQGALELIRSHINAAILELTGMVPTEGAQPVPPSGDNNSGTNSSNPSDSGGSTTADAARTLNPFLGISNQEITQLIPEIVTQAYGTKLAQRRNPDTKSD